MPKRSSSGKEPSTIPERIGAYRLESPLGRGGMGEVFLAWDERLERPVAIKRIRTDVFLEGRQRERFRREARMAARLSHASIVQIHDLVADESGDAIVMEYVEGQTLADRLARGPLPIADALRIAREIAEGLAAAHQAGLIHRDLKAENVIVTPAGHAKILDFGLARPMSWDGGEMLTQRGALVGTCYAMSPEQASGDDLDERSDLFSFGALLYQMIAGRSPFRAETPQATLTRVLSMHPRPLSEARPDTPPTLVHLVARLLAKDRDDRPRNAERVVKSLQQIERDLPAEPPLEDSICEMPTLLDSPAVLPPRPPGPSRTSGKTRRVRSVKVAFASAILAAAAGASLYLMSQRPAPPLRVLVAQPQILSPADERLAFAATGVLSSTLESLGALQGLSALDPSIVYGSPSSLGETARNAAADEIFVSSLVREDGMARVSMRRIDVGSGRVIWSNTLRVPAEPESARLLADRIDERVRQAFPELTPRPGRPRLEARDQDYAELLEIRRRVEQGTSDVESELARLDRIVHASPRFLEARILAAELGFSQFRSSREPSHLDRARTYVELARALAPDDPRTLRAELKVALEARKPKQAEAILRHLEALLPGDPEVMVLHARALEKEGRLTEAAEALRTAVRWAPTWRNIYWLSTLETDLGRIPEARGLLDRLLKQAPDNAWVLEQLAYLEFVYGNLKRAEDLYDRLSTASPRNPTHLTNLGLTRSLQGRYLDAKEAYDRALKLSPGQIVALINLADAELALGNRISAEALYGVVLQRLADNMGGGTLPPEEEMMKAQCLARLGRTTEAREAARHALRQRPGDPQLLYEAAKANSVAGDLGTALQQAKEARAGGVTPRWFSVPSFDALRQDAWMQSLNGFSRQ